MFAVVKIFGHQYKVAVGDTILIDRAPALVGDTLVFREVLTLSTNDNIVVGTPLVENAAVAVEVLDQRRSRKVVVFKKRRRKNSRRKNGHRSHYTVLKVTHVEANGSALVEKRANPAEQLAEFILLKAAQGRPDPLRFVEGLDTAAERRLYASGIYHYRQLAVLPDETAQAFGLTAEDATALRASALQLQAEYAALTFGA